MRLPITLLCFILPLGAQIARDGTCGASANSCTFSATATGDLKIIVASRTTTTIPSLPAGWTSIGTVTGASFAARIGCNVSSSSGDTGSGTWSNGTRIVGVSFSGTGVGNTANCNTTGIGATSNNNGTSTAVNFPALSGVSASGKSWVAGFAFDSTVVVGAPTGMTQVATSSTGQSAVANDTEGVVSSWSSQNVTVTSSNWISFVIEILAPPAAAAYMHHKVSSQ